MDLGNVGADLFGGPEAALLRALSRLTRAVSGREATRLAGLPQTTARRALARLSKIGIVDAEEEPHSVRFSLNRHHVLWPAVRDVLSSGVRVEQLISRIVVERAGESATAILFGSMARGDATSDNDTDIAVILPDEFDSADREALVDELTNQLETFTGNRVQTLTLSMSDLRGMVKEHDPLVQSWTQDARTITGEDFSTLIAKASR